MFISLPIIAYNKIGCLNRPRNFKLVPIQIMRLQEMRPTVHVSNITYEAYMTHELLWA